MEFSAPCRAGALLLAGLLLAGCGGRLFGGEAPPRPERIEIDEQALQSEEMPPLASVPDTRPAVTPLAERAALERALQEDRAHGQLQSLQSSAITINPDALPPGPAAPAAAMPGAAPTGMVGVIHFAHASTSLDGRDREILQQVARLQRQRGGRLLVVGHASARTGTLDPQRHAEVNLQMSQRRADAVAAALRQAGVPADSLQVQALGDRGRRYHEFMATGEAGNRRVEIYLQN